MDAGGIWAPRVAAMAGVRSLDARRPPARGPEGRARLGAAARHAVLPRPGPPRLREGGIGRDRVRRVRAGSGRSMDRRRALGARRAVASPRHGAVRAAASRRGQAVPVHRRRRDREARLSSGRDDPGREPARRPGADRPRPVVRGRAVVERFGAAGGSAALGRWIAGETRASTSPRTVRGASDGSTTTPGGSRSSPARPTATTTGSATRSITTSGEGRNGCRRCTVACRTRARCSRRSTGGSGRSASSPASPGGGRERISGRSAGRVHHGSTGCGEEHRAVRERAGLFDLSSFGKIEVTGPDAVRLLERAAANRVDVRRAGGLHAVPRRERRDRRGRDGHAARRKSGSGSITGAAAVDGDLGWLRRVALGRGPGRVGLRDASEELAVIAVWGRAALDVLARVPTWTRRRRPDDRTRGRIGPAPAWAQR